MLHLDFPGWLRIAHLVNIIFLTLLIRSGIEILATRPKLYWHDDSRPDSEWARFTTKVMPKDLIYTSLAEQEDYASLVSMPGHGNLGLGTAPASSPSLVLSSSTFRTMRRRSVSPRKASR